MAERNPFSVFEKSGVNVQFSPRLTVALDTKMATKTQHKKRIFEIWAVTFLSFQRLDEQNKKRQSDGMHERLHGCTRKAKVLNEGSKTLFPLAYIAKVCLNTNGPFYLRCPSGPVLHPKNRSENWKSGKIQYCYLFRRNSRGRKRRVR